MAQFSKEIMYDTYSRSVVKFVYGATANNIAAYGVTSQVSASELYGYQGLTNVNATTLNVAKVSWMVPNTAPSSILLSWGISGQQTGQAMLYLTNSGSWDFTSQGYELTNSLSGPSSGRNNAITIANNIGLSANDGVTVILELDKIQGFGLTGYTGS